MKSFVFPGNIESEILSISAQQIPYMRTQFFSDLMIESETMLLDLLECPEGRVISYTASGTAAMDACVTSFVSTCRKTLVINGGTFGARWGELCRYYDLSHDEFPVEFGKAPDWSLLSEKLSSGNYDCLLMQHHETSSGYLYNLKEISRLCKKNDISLVVDAISSFLSDDFSMVDYGVDIAILSSHKGLNLPPGLSFVVLSNSVVEFEAFPRQSFYLDWDEHLRNLRRGQPPFSPATPLFMQLHARLKMVKKSGVSKIVESVARKADFFRNSCQDLGYSFSATRRSNCLTGLYLPFKARLLVDALLEKQIYVMPSAAENMIRVAHLGTLDTSDHLELIEEISKWEKMGKK